MSRLEECAVWWTDARADPRLMEVLSPAEQKRAASIHGVGRQSFVAARALIRVALADMLGEPVPSLAVVNSCRVCGSEEHGRPTLPGLDLSVSICHSGGRVGVALAPIAIGIDVEALSPLRTQETSQLVDLALTPAERVNWAALPPERRAGAALAWWTRKESVLKAIGWGLAIAPDLLEVSGPDESPAVTRWGPAALEILGFEMPVVHLHELKPGPDRVGFLASVGSAVNITEHSVDPALHRPLAKMRWTGGLGEGCTVGERESQEGRAAGTDHHECCSAGRLHHAPGR